MRIPTLVSGKVIDDKGEFTPTYQDYFDTIIRQLQQSFSDQGIVIPSMSSNDIQSLNIDAASNRLVIDETTGELKININGIFRTIQVV